MATVFLVHSMVEFKGGERVAVLRKVFDSEERAKAYIVQCQGELGALCNAPLVGQTPQGPRPIGPGKMMYDAIGVVAVAYTTTEVEMTGAIDAPPASRLII